MTDPATTLWCGLNACTPQTARRPAYRQAGTSPGQSRLPVQEKSEISQDKSLIFTLNMKYKSGTQRNIPVSVTRGVITLFIAG